MKRPEAWDLIQSHVTNKNLQKHMLATEAVMIELASRFEEDTDSWGLAGLLHDLDIVETEKDFSRHGYRTAEILEPLGISSEILDAIKSHPGHTKRITKMDKALYAADPITGLIVAATLMHPTRKLKHLDQKFLQRRFAEKRFAAGASREAMSACSNLGLELGEFMMLVRDGMLSIVDKLEL